MDNRPDSIETNDEVGLLMNKSDRTQLAIIRTFIKRGIVGRDWDRVVIGLTKLDRLLLPQEE